MAADPINKPNQILADINVGHVGLTSPTDSKHLKTYHFTLHLPIQYVSISFDAGVAQCL